MTEEIMIIGGGLAGSEAAWQAAKRGVKVRLFEMRPNIETGAHQTSDLAELVCSNSLGSAMLDRASGLLKEEIKRMGSLLMGIAEEYSIPAGSALAVDRTKFLSKLFYQLLDLGIVFVDRLSGSFSACQKP